MREASEMASLQPHINVVQFYGICRVDEHSSSLVTAFCQRGALKDVQTLRVSYIRL
jgi:serine/threonine protein kinase